MLSGPPHEASAAHTRCPGTLESERAGSQANRVAPGARPSAARGGLAQTGFVLNTYISLHDAFSPGQICGASAPH